MALITTHSDWGYWDQLEGRTLEDGERLRVTWPDGTVEEVAAAVEKRSERISDMGTPYDMPVVRAYAEAEHHGVKVRVPLAGLSALRLPPDDWALCKGMTPPPEHFGAGSGGIHRVVLAAVDLGVPPDALEFLGVSSLGWWRLRCGTREWCLDPLVIARREGAVDAARVLAEHGPKVAASRAPPGEG